MKIEKYSFGSIVVDGKKYETDLILSWDGEVQERIKSHEFKKSELYEILQKDPEIVIIGTGYSGLVKIK
ncbi:MAG: MTH938/NDUFAF3 family protein, partial [Methanosarcinales archaeon]